MSRHALPGKHTRREGRCTDRALHLEHMTVRLGATAKVVTAHYTGKAAALAGADHVHILVIGKDVYQDAVARLQTVAVRRRHVALGSVGLGFVDLRWSGR